MVLLTGLVQHGSRAASVGVPARPCRQQFDGVTAGVAGAYLLSRYVESRLFQTPRHDWTTYAIAVILLAAVALLASLTPARRGASVDPVVALRAE